MSQRKKFDESDLINALKTLGSKLPKKVRINLLGGCAMTFIGAKAATKDIDVVLRSTKDVKLLVKAMENAGFKRVKKLGRDYQTLGAWIVMEHPDGMRFDIFNKQVCGALEISDSMESRAKFYKSFEDLYVYLMSPEDIILFKGITDRSDDLDDMRILVERGVDWKIVVKECKSQKNAGMWADAFANKLLDLKEIHGIDSPILRTMIDYGNMDLPQRVFSKIIVKNKMNATEIAATISKKSAYSESWTRKQLKMLEKKGFLTKEKRGKTFVYSIKEMQLPSAKTNSNNLFEMVDKKGLRISKKDIDHEIKSHRKEKRKTVS